jgi:hypothetical protein
MTDLASLLERLREGPIRTGDTEDGEYELFDVEDAAQTMHEAASSISALDRELEEALRYATHLLTSYVNQYCDPVPDWAPLPDLIGLLTQIDNASTVTAEILARAEAAEAKVARMGVVLKEIEAHDIRIEYHGLATSPSVVEIGPMGQIARSALQSEKDREGEDGR